MFRMQLDTDNAAFDGENLNREVARILRQAAHLIEGGTNADKCRDENGNHIGHYILKT